VKIYGMKMHNFMRFGESDNSIVFNVTKSQKNEMQKDELTFDQLYAKLSDNPIQYIEEVNKIEDDNVLEGMVGIAGTTAGSFDSSNGSGKSTIFEAMAFLFYDKIVRQTANNDKKAVAGLSVVTKVSGKYPKGLKESFVEAYFEEDGRIYRLKRGRSFTKSQKSSSPIFEFDCIKDNEVDSLSSHRKKDTKRSLDEVIVEDYDIFVNTVMFGQNDAGKFLTGTDKVKKDMIIELLKLEDVVHGCIDVVRSRKKEENSSLNQLVTRSESLKDMVIKLYEEFTLQNCEKTYCDDMIDLVSKNIKDRLNEKGLSKKEENEKKEKIVEKIKELENSEVLREIKALIEEGKQLVKEKKDLEERKDKEFSAWLKTLKESEVERGRWESSVEKLRESKKYQLNKKKELEENIQSFDLDKNKEMAEKCQKAIGLKDKYSEKLQEVVKKREKTIEKFSEFSAALKIKVKDLNKLQSQVENAKDKDKYLCPECKSLVSKEHTLKKIEEIENVISKNTESMSQIKDKLEKLDEAKNTLESRLNQIDDYKDQLQKLLNKDREYSFWVKELGEIVKRSDETQEQIDSQLENVNQAEEKIEKYQKKCKEVNLEFDGDISSIANKIDKKREEVATLKEKSKGIGDRIADLAKEKEEIEKFIDKINNDCGSLQEKSKQVISLAKQISEEAIKIKESKRKLLRLGILESAFGLEGVQTRIVAKYLPLLNMYIKQFLDTLSDGKLIVNLMVNDKSKIDMEVIGGTADNYIMLSGGEKMIVRLAVDVGLSLLSFSRTSKKPDMICLDEIFGPLDRDHIKGVFRMLNELKDRFQKVFLISHKSEIQSIVKNNIVVEKSSGNLGLSKITGIRDISL